MKSALGDLRILDLADEKGMFCSRLLGDMGADVIKVEKPPGDPLRYRGPYLGGVVHPERSLSFWHFNASKRGITLDIESSQGKEIFKRLTRTVDVMVETFAPGYLNKLGLGWTDLSNVNPRLILVSITGFGQTGPKRNFHSDDLVASALGGQMYVTGEPDTPPLKPYGKQSYHVASLFAAIGILLALRSRRMSGRGQHVDISLQESVAAVTEHVSVGYHFDGVVAKRQGNLSWNGAFAVFPCRDGYIVLSLFRNWETLVEWLKSEGMAEDLNEEKWRDAEVRQRHLGHIVNVLKRWTRTHTTDELFKQGQLMGFPWARVSSPREVVSNPQLRERQFFTPVTHPELGRKITYAGAPYKFSQSHWRIFRAPLVGEHNREIYAELGLTPGEMHSLAKRGVI